MNRVYVVVQHHYDDNEYMTGEVGAIKVFEKYENAYDYAKAEIKNYENILNFKFNEYEDRVDNFLYYNSDDCSHWQIQIQEKEIN